MISEETINKTIEYLNDNPNAGLRDARKHLEELIEEELSDTQWWNVKKVLAVRFLFN